MVIVITIVIIIIVVVMVLLIVIVVEHACWEGFQLCLGSAYPKRHG